MDAEDFRTSKATDIAFRDPLTEVTRKVRTQLLFVAAFAILVKVYDLKVNKTPWLDIDVPATAPQLLDGALSVAVTYLFFVFVLYAYQDIRRWRISGDIHLVHASFNLVIEARNDLNTISQLLEKVTPDRGIGDGIRQAVVDASTRIPQTLQKLQDLQSELSSLSRLQWLRLLVIEIGAPALVGGIALVKTWTALIPFVVAVFK
jgi:hypothetical protein